MNNQWALFKIGESVKEKWDNRRGKIVGVWNIEPVGLMYELSFGNQLWTECFWYSELEEVYDEERSMAQR